MTERLFTYGTLSPGQPNQHVLQGVTGSWEAASVAGTLHADGWGAALGYPAIVLDPEGQAVPGFLFSSDELAAHWDRLDEFEGVGYRRVLTQVRRADDSLVTAYIYELNDSC